MHAPPFEYDPVTFAPPAELVEVGSEGSVTSWSWMPEPLEGQPLAHPFAWALIRLDGADTAMLHAVDAGSAGAMRTGHAGPGPVGGQPGRPHPRHRLLRAVRPPEPKGRGGLDSSAPRAGGAAVPGLRSEERATTGRQPRSGAPEARARARSR